MPNQFSRAGAQAQKPIRFAPIYNGRYTTGLWSNRSPLRDAATSRDIEQYYGPTGDALIAGSNVEISNKLTLIRRPGNSAFDTNNYQSVSRFYDFHIFGPTTEQINVMIDQANALYSWNGGIASLVWTKSKGAGQTFMQSVGNTLYFANGVDNKKWLQSLLQWTPNTAITTPFMSTFLIDPNGNIQQLTGAGMSVSSVFAQSDTVQIFTSVNILGVIQAGDEIVFPQGMAASFLDGQTVTVLAAYQNTFTFNFVTADYALTPETGVVAMVYPGDGNPSTGPAQPIWSLTVPTAANNFRGGTTQDGTAVWTNRGNPVQNWGIQPPTTVLTPTINGSLPVWDATTYYSLPGVVVDSNGNVQQVVTAGLSGAAAPSWNKTLGGTTQDGLLTTGVLWKMVASAAMLNWQANNFYPTGSFLVETPAGGSASLFQLSAPTTPYLSGTVNAYLFPHAHTGDVGDFDLPFPTALGDSVAQAAGLSGFNFSIAGTGTGGSINWDTINSAGEVTGTTQPFAGQDVSDLNIIITGTLEVPVAGTHVFSITHGDGLCWGIGGGAIFGSGTPPVNVGTNTAANGYPTAPAGHNVNVTLNGGNAWVDTYTYDFPTAGTYPVEFNIARWDKPNAQMIVTCDSNVIPSGQPTGGGVSGSTEPVWPAFTTADAPDYANVTESSGRLQWNNLGPVTDFAWAAATNFTLPDTFIVDAGGFIQAPFRTGISGATAPSFSETLNALTADAPNLIWINQGPYSNTSGQTKGTVTASNGGWVYSISLVNTLDVTVSNATKISKPTGDITDAQGVVLEPGDGLQNITIDPQADYVAIWRSTDGFTTPFLVPGPNDYALPVTIPLWQYLTEGYTDTTPDTGLNNLISAPVLGENTPPAIGATALALHIDRLFYAVGATGYWTSGPDDPAGNGLNGTSPLNFSEQGSLVKRLEPITTGVLVFTVSDINYIAGAGTSTNPIQPAVVFQKGIGLLSYNAMDVNGSIIGFFTTDHQFIVLDPNAGVTRLGCPIEDQLKLNNGQPGQSWNPANVYVAWHTNGDDQAWYLADGVNGWYRLMTTPAPDTGFAWSPFATIVPGCKAVQSIEVTPGNHQLLLGPVGTGQILQRDTTTNADNGETYPANAVLGSAVLAQPGQVAVVSFITVESVGMTNGKPFGTPIVLGVLVDEALPYYTGSFDILKRWTNDPPNLKPSASIPAQRFYLSELEDDAVECRHMQIQVSWAAENAPNELLTLTVYGGFLQE